MIQTRRRGGERSKETLKVSEREGVLEALREVGTRKDQDIDVADTALLLASLDRPGEPLEPYRRQLADLGSEVRAATARTHSVDMQVAALADVLAGRWSLRGDDETYDDPRNANLMHVLDRRRGLPVALGILWLHAGRAYGADITGLAFPSHFLVRLGARGQRVIIDVFRGGRTLAAEDLRSLLKETHGAEKEIEPQHYAAVGNRDVLIRLQNNIKLRTIAADDLERGLEVLRTMTLIAPERGELWWETAVLQSRLGNLKTAIATLEGFLAGPSAADGGRGELEELLRRLRSKVN
ncbi:MAG: transglutaminase family protein [Rhodospirillales bacterium]|nr:transglutaminase family protein [Rhodospirillales bacterium]